ncbi:MAG: hypothetical protein CMH30_07580 [Micavibrio sp.]|nr:hypothetical protein [Micavibrio sp.]
MIKNKKMSRLILMSAVVASFVSGDVLAQEASANAVPTLVITNKPLPTILRQGSENVFSGVESVDTVRVQKPKAVDDEVVNEGLDTPLFEFDRSPIDTQASQKVQELQKEYSRLEGALGQIKETIRNYQNDGRAQAAKYYASVAAIQTQLQAGTTPGNPRLVERLNVAQDNLEGLSNSIANFNSVAVQIADVSSVASFLMQSIQATYGLTGAVKEDHERLADLEDNLSGVITNIERLLNITNEEITRASGYLAAERRNLRTLSLAVANGDIYGANLSNRLYTQTGAAMFPVSTTPGPNAERPASTQPLVVIRFNDPNTNYEQALYTAVSEAQDKYPGARFELVAVDPGTGNAAKRAIESAKSKRNAERVLRSMVQMGVDANAIAMSNASREDARAGEVHVLLR